MTEQDVEPLSYYRFTSSLAIAEVERRIRDVLRDDKRVSVRDVSSVPCEGGILVAGRWALGSTVQWLCVSRGAGSAVTFRVLPPKAFLPASWVVLLAGVWCMRQLSATGTVGQMWTVGMTVVLATGACYTVIFKATERVGLMVQQSVQGTGNGPGGEQTVA